jgi:hypothetical protein
MGTVPIISISLAAIPALLLTCRIEMLINSFQILGITEGSEMHRIVQRARDFRFIGIFIIIFGTALHAQQAPINCKGPLSEERLIGMLKRRLADERVRAFVNKCNIDFPVTPEAEQRLRDAKASNAVIAAVYGKYQERLRLEEEKLWPGVKDGRNAAQLREYLKRFPSGEHASEARYMLSNLTKAEDLRGKIRQARKEGKWQETETWLKQLAGFQPEDAEMRFWKGWVTEERLRWESMTVAEAQQEIVLPEMQAEDVRKAVEAARDETLRQLDEKYGLEREKAGQVDPKGEYETTARYKARLDEATQRQKIIDLHWQAEKQELEKKYAAELEQKASPFRTRIEKLKNRTYLMQGVVAQRIGYDADASRLSARIDGQEYWFRIEPLEMQALDPRLGTAKVEQYLGEEHAQERALVDTATSARFKGILRAAEEERLRREELARIAWVDPATGLMWAPNDNGSDVDWNEAMSYCQQLRLGALTDWRLPEIEELEGTYDAPSKQLYKVKSGIKLSKSWVWSATRAGSGSAWYFLFLSGERNSFLLDSRLSLRALCVRHSEE